MTLKVVNLRFTKQTLFYILPLGSQTDKRMTKVKIVKFLREKVNSSLKLILWQLYGSKINTLHLQM